MTGFGTLDAQLECQINEAARQNAYRPERFVWHRSQSLLRLVFGVAKPELVPCGEDGKPFEMCLCRLGVEDEDDLNDALEEFRDLVGGSLLTEINVTDDGYLSPQQYARVCGVSIN